MFITLKIGRETASLNMDHIVSVVVTPKGVDVTLSTRETYQFSPQAAEPLIKAIRSNPHGLPFLG